MIDVLHFCGERGRHAGAYDRLPERGIDRGSLFLATYFILFFAFGDTDRVVGQAENDILGDALFVHQIVQMGGVERIFVDESRVAAPRPDVAEREYVFGRFVELVDLGCGNTVSIQNLAEGFASIDDLLLESVVVGGNAV